LTNQIKLYTKKLDILHSKKKANPDLPNQETSNGKHNNPKKIPHTLSPNQETSNGKHQVNIPRKKRCRKPKNF